MGKRKATIEELRVIVEKEGCKLVSDEYINSGTKLDVQCECGDIFKVNMEKFKAGQNRCNKCVFIRKENLRKLKYSKKVQEYVEQNSKCSFIKIATKNIELKCQCGEIFKVSFSNFKNHNKRECNKCSEKTKKNKLHEKRIIEVKQKVEEYGCLWISGNYINQMSILGLRCSCGEDFSRGYYRLIADENSRKCDSCSASMISKINEIKEYISSNSSCEFIDNRGYINKEDKIKIKCQCGSIFYKTFFDFKETENKCCKKCSGINDFSIEDVKRFIETNSKCKLISNKYENMQKPLRVLCECGIEFHPSFAMFKFQNKRQCNNCGYAITGSKNSLSYEDVKSNVEKMGVKLISNIYKNNSEKMIFKCSCGEVFTRSYYEVSQGVARCLKCSRSKGEMKVMNYLDKLNITYELQKQYNDCRGEHKPLLFDFKIDLNNNYYILLEYDGEQHYKPVKFNGTSDKNADWIYNRTLRYDQIKNEYCKKNNIPLIRIPYWNFDNIEEILDRELSKYKS